LENFGKFWKILENLGFWKILDFGFWDFFGFWKILEFGGGGVCK
jgi:hypothetical protein